MCRIARLNVANGLFLKYRVRSFSKDICGHNKRNHNFNWHFFVQYGKQDGPGKAMFGYETCLKSKRTLIAQRQDAFLRISPQKLFEREYLLWF